MACFVGLFNGGPVASLTRIVQSKDEIVSSRANLKQGPARVVNSWYRVRPSQKRGKMVVQSEGWISKLTLRPWPGHLQQLAPEIGFMPPP